MKTSFFVLFLCALAINTPGQTAQNQGAASEAPQDTLFAIVQRDANANIWQRTTYEQMPSGEWVPHIKSYQEIATGLNFKNPDTGEWETSSEEIEIVQGGAVAKHGQHKVIFAADLATVGAIDMETPDGQRLQSHMLGLCYFDKASGQSVFIAEVTNSIGQLISSNQVWYDNAFTGVKAGVRYTYKRDGFEQDVILEEQPPSPESYGLNSSTTVLQAYTEFISPPEPVISLSFITEGEGQQLLDKTLAFSDMKIGRGYAFLAANSSRGIPVAKDWATLEGRQFLIEQVPVSEIRDQLQSLPSPQASVRFSNSVVNVVSTKRLLPGSTVAKAGTNQMKMANLQFRTSGFVLDYTALNTSQTNYTFQGDTTYFVSGTVNLSGTTVIEGGAVIKYTNDASSLLNITGTIACKTAPYRPAIFTAQNDDSIGEQIAGSTGSLIMPPTITTTALKLGSAQTLSNMRFIDFNRAIDFEGNFGAKLTLQDIQFVDDNVGVFTSLVIPPSVSGENILMVNLATGFAAYDEIAALINLTAYNVTTLANFTNSASSSFNATNSIVVNSTTAAWMSGAHNAFYSSTSFGGSATNLPSNPFQTVGAAQCYLASDSPARNAGTVNISSTLLSDLHHKTTYPPILYSNVVVSVNTTLNPQAQRDTDTPDLGYHYDPIDYLVDRLYATNVFLTVAPGTVVASYNDVGILITDGGVINSIGTMTDPIWYTKYSCIQEQPIMLVSTPSSGQIVDSFHAGTAPSGQYRFSKFSCLANGGSLLYESGDFAYSNLLVEDCEFWNNQTDFSGKNSSTVNLKNDLFARSRFAASGTGYANDNLVVSNSLFWNTVVALSSGPDNYIFFNNSFDNATIAGRASRSTVNGYNAYLVNTNRLGPPGATDIVSTNTIAYQTGPLGYFYQPTNSILINAGSITADLASLYHYTTTTNQVKETNSVVDIGYHYVALNANNAPIDTDGDGLPDYLEDQNGNGIYDSGDPFDWKNPDADGSGGTATFSNGMSLLILEPKPSSQIP